jgi:ketosteroid isomerase-like protein
MPTSTPNARHPAVDRLHRAINDHDVEAVVACFAVDYRNDTPAHPTRSFTGRDQLRRNWRRILAAVPDLRARLLESHADGDIAWAEWDWSGTRADETPLRMRGVTVLGVDADTVAWARFYMEPVDADGMDVDAAVLAQVGPQ